VTKPEQLTTDERKAIKCEACGRNWGVHTSSCARHPYQPRKCPACRWSGELRECEAGFSCPECAEATVPDVPLVEPPGADPDDVLRDNRAMKDLVRAVVRKAGGRVVLTKAEFLEATDCVLEVLPVKDADGERVYVQCWPRRADVAPQPQEAAP
jgi:hypothetical protein